MLFKFISFHFNTYESLFSPFYNLLISSSSLQQNNIHFSSPYSPSDIFQSPLVDHNFIIIIISNFSNFVILFPFDSSTSFLPPIPLFPSHSKSPQFLVFQKHTPFPSNFHTHNSPRIRCDVPNETISCCWFYRN